MMPAAKHFDPVLGVDIHMIQPPGPVPPVPVPHPFIGMVIDPMDYVPFLGATVMVGGIPRAQAGTAGKNIPSHIPIGGTFIKPPGNECEVFMGSSTVLADGDAFSHLAHPALSCHDIGMPPPPRAKKKSKTKSLVLPTSVVLSIPSGVLVGGPPTISMMALGMRAGMAAAGALFKKVKGLRKGKGKKGKGKGKKGKSKDNAPCGTDAHPVDIVTGGCVDDIIDYDPPGRCPFRWARYYDSTELDRTGPMGRGFRHAYELTLEILPQGYRYTDENGEETEFPPIAAGAGFAQANGALLRKSGDSTWELVEPRQRILEFQALQPDKPARLVGIRQGGGQLRIGYDAQARMLWVRDSEGRLYQVEHDGFGRVTAIHQRAAQPPYAVQATPLRFQYDAEGCLTGVVDAYGHAASYEYDHGRITRLRDRRGFSFYYEYDELGRVVRTRGEDGLWNATLEYVPEANLTIVRFADGGEWLRFYDGDGRVTDVVNPDGGMLTRRFDEQGRVAEQLDPGDELLDFQYDAFGAQEGRRDVFGRLLPPSWDTTDPPDIDEYHIPPSAAGWEYGGLLHSPTRPLGGITERAVAMVPAAARVALEIEVESFPPPRHEYDPMGRLSSKVYADGTSESWQYDAEGNWLRYTDRDGSTYQRTYRSWNLLASETDPLGHVTRYEHSLRGEVTRVVDAGGTETAYVRDPMERICAVSRGGLPRESYTWSQGSALLQKTGANGEALVRFELGPGGLPVKRLLARGGEQALACDARGRPTGAKTALLKVSRAWDDFGRRLQDLCDGLGVENTFGPDGVLTSTLLGKFTTTYRRRGRWDTDVVDPTGARHRVAGDASGIAVRELSSGRVEVSRYDEAGRCLGRHVSGAGQEWIRRYRYSPTGELREVDDSAAGRTAYRYDAAHRLVGERRNQDPERVFQYDAAGNIIALPGGPRISCTAGNRLARAGEHRFQHDARGHVSRREGPDGDGVLELEYDSLDMLVALHRPRDEAWRWEAAYDPYGRRMWKEHDGRRTRYFWDGDRLAGEQDPDGRVRVYVYADDQAWVPVMFVDYASADAEAAQGERYYIFTSQVGAPIRVEDDRGETVWSAVLEPYGRAEVRARGGLELNLRFPGHYFDPETGLHYNRYRYYDPALGRFLQSDPIGAAGGLNVYAYTANPLVEVDLQGLRKCKDARGKTKGKAEGPPQKKSAKLGDDVDDIAKNCGMDPQHVKNLQARAATSPNGERIIVRASNPESLKWHNKTYDGKPCVAKPVTVKAKTAKEGPLAGLVVKSAPDEVPPKGFTFDEAGVMRDPQGRAVHGDYDLQHVSDKNGPVNTNDPFYQQGLNDDVCPEHNQFQHGANDDYRPIKDADGKPTTIEGGDKPGRNPDPDEKYMVVEPDGTVKQVDSTKELQQYYKDNGMDWPYPDY